MGGRGMVGGGRLLLLGCVRLGGVEDHVDLFKGHFSQAATHRGEADLGFARAESASAAIHQCEEGVVRGAGAGCVGELGELRWQVHPVDLVKGLCVRQKGGGEGRADDAVKVNAHQESGTRWSRGVFGVQLSCAEAVAFQLELHHAHVRCGEERCAERGSSICWQSETECVEAPCCWLPLLLLRAPKVAFRQWDVGEGRRGCTAAAGRVVHGDGLRERGMECVAQCLEWDHCMHHGCKQREG